MDTPSTSTVILPCDLPQWKEVKLLLNEVTQTKSTDYVVSVLQKVYDMVHSNVSPNAMLCSELAARPKTKSVFAGLKFFLDKRATTEEYDEFFDKILPNVIQRAINIEFFPECLLHRSTLKQLEIKRQFAASIVACAFLCIFPICIDENNLYCNLNLNDLFDQLNSESGYSRLKSVIQYLSAMARQTDGPSGTITFIRQKLSGHKSTNEILTSDILMCPITVHSSHLINSTDQQFLKIFIGMGASGLFSDSQRWTQEILASLIFPELLSGRVILGPVEINEVVTVQSSEPLCGSNSSTSEMSFIETSLLPVNQTYGFYDVLQEISRLECAFRQQVFNSYKNEQHMVNKKAVYETSDTDLPVDSSSDSVSNIHVQSAGCHTRRAPLSSLRTKSWRSASSIGSFNLSVSRGQSVDLDTSSTSSTGEDTLPGPGAVPRRRSAAMHNSTGVSSRRGSALQGQSSVNSEGSSIEFGSYSRRRSSGLSDVSLRSSSSSGKRSSADYSSEFDDYMDNLQQHRSLAVAVIEEENGGMHDAMVAHMDTISEDLGREAPDVEQKMNSPRPLSHDANAVSSRSQLSLEHLPPGHSLLEHFVDNLINEAAQDSRFELANYLSRQHSQAEHSLVSETWTAGDTLKVEDDLENRGIKANACSRVFRHSSLGRDQEADAFYAAYADNITRGILSSALEIVAGDSLSVNAVPSSASFVSSSSASEERCHTLVMDVPSLDNFAASLSESICYEAFDTYRQLVNKNLAFVSSQVENKGSRSQPYRSFLSSENSLFKPPKWKRSCHHVGQIGNRVRVSNSPNVSLFHEMLPTHRQKASHFKDSVLSDFEDQLVRSGASSPGTLMLTDSRRRSSEPAISSHCTGRRRNRHIASISFCDSSDLQLTSSGAFHSEFISSLFDTDVTSHSTCGSDAALGLECYAQKVVLEAFNSALTDVCRLSMSSRNHVSYSHATDVVKLSQCIVDRALFEATEIMAAASSAAIYSGSDSDSELHLVATEFAQRVINDAAEMYTQTPFLRPVASGVFGQWCVFSENQQLIAIIEWIAASLACIPHFHFYTSGSATLVQMNRVLRIVNDRCLTTSALMNELEQWCASRRDSSSSVINLFDFLILRLT